MLRVVGLDRLQLGAEDTSVATSSNGQPMSSIPTDMDPSVELPGLSPPANGDRATLAWRADLGPGQRLADLADHMKDLDTVVCLGERIGTRLAHHAARQQLLYQAVRRGPHSLQREANEFGYPLSDRDLNALDEWLHTGFYPRPGRFLFDYPADLIDVLADARSVRMLGTPTDVVQVEYRNPLEVILGGSGFLLLGVIYVLRLARDWSHTRRIGAARAEAAESVARRATTHADFVEWLVVEATQGRLHQPPHELVDLVTRPEIQTLDRIANNEIQLQLPTGMDPKPSADG